MLFRYHCNAPKLFSLVIWKCSRSVPIGNSFSHLFFVYKCLDKLSLWWIQIYMVQWKQDCGWCKFTLLISLMIAQESFYTALWSVKTFDAYTCINHWKHQHIIQLHIAACMFFWRLCNLQCFPKAIHECWANILANNQFSTSHCSVVIYPNNSLTNH